MAIGRRVYRHVNHQPQYRRAATAMAKRGAPGGSCLNVDPQAVGETHELRRWLRRPGTEGQPANRRKSGLSSRILASTSKVRQAASDRIAASFELLVARLMRFTCWFDACRRARHSPGCVVSDHLANVISQSIRLLRPSTRYPHDARQTVRP